MDNNELSTNLASLGTDCISRQQAIDALTEYGNGRAVFISVGEAVIRIEQLPPIQPANCSEFPNNSDTISRQAAIDALCNDYCGGHQDCKYYPNCENLRSVQKLPSAQPERAMGTWMPDTMCYYEERFICSECKGNYKVDTCMGKPMWNFCPNCGADMRGEQNG